MAMPTPEPAFKAYYESMTDAELLTIANNRKSFIPVAQKALDEELHRRQLKPTIDSPIATSHPTTLLTRVRQILRRKTSGPSDPAPEQHQPPSTVP